MPESTSPTAPDSMASGSTVRDAAHRQQAARLEKLLANYDRPVQIPSLPGPKTLRPPRETMKNVSGSSAAAGSGDFHVYKHGRRREFERVKLMEEQEQRQQQQKQFEQRQQQQQATLDAKTDKNRAKRDKKKAARLAARQSKGATATGEAVHPGRDDQPSPLQDGEPESLDDSADGQRKKRRIGAAEGLPQVLYKAPEQSDEDDEKGQMMLI